MKILVINGPNINMLGIREPKIYGSQSYDELIRLVSEHAESIGIECECYQSNHEGDIVDEIQDAYFSEVDGIVINPGAYTHTSIAIADALKSVGIPFVEVHISKLGEREAFRQISYIRDFAKASIVGKGLVGYIEAIDILVSDKK